MENKSIFVLVKSEKANETANLEIHVNVWRLPLDWNSKYYSFSYIDIGIKLYDYFSLYKKLIIALPFPVNINEIIDLGHVILEKDNLLSVVFNDLYKSERIAQHSQIYLCQPYNSFYNNSELCSENKDSKNNTNNNSKPNDTEFYFWKICNESDIKLNKKKLGGINYSILELKLPKYGFNKSNKDIRNNIKNLYIRLRIKVKGTPFSSSIQLDNRLFQGLFSKRDLFDFRINDIRDISDDAFNYFIRRLSPAMDFNLPLINKIHFYLLAPTNYNLEYDREPIEGVRLLENDRWVEYFPKCDDSKKYKRRDYLLAYHWKKNYEKIAKNNYFSIFFQGTYEDTDRIKLAKYLLLIFLLGVFSSFIGSILYKFFAE